MIKFTESILFELTTLWVVLAEPYVGKYYSADYVRRQILRQTDEEIIEQDALIEKEIENGVIPDPNAMVDPATGMPMDPNAMGGNPSLPPPPPGQQPGLGQPNDPMQNTSSPKDPEAPALTKKPPGGEI